MSAQIIKYAVDMDTMMVRPINAVKYEQKCRELNTNCFEMIPDDIPVKLYFDVDIKNTVENGPDLMQESDRLLQGVVDYLNSKFENAELAIGTSNSPSFTPYKESKPISKLSFRIIINNYTALKRHQKLIVQQLNNSASQFMDSEDLATYYSKGVFDIQPYKEGNQKIRSLYASKPNENRQMKLHSGTFEQMCITAFIPENAEMIVMPDPEKRQSSLSTPSTTDSNVYRKIFNDSLNAGLLTKYSMGDYGIWFKFGCIIKNIFDDESLFHEFSKLDTIRYDYDTVSSQWEKIEKKPFGIGWGSFIYYIKESYYSKAMEIIHDAYANVTVEKVEVTNLFIASEDLDDPYKISIAISATLKHTLVLCRENWYMLTNLQLWKQQKEPSFYITNEVRKYIDESNKQLVEKIAQTEGEQKEKLIEKSKVYLSSYKKISTSSFLNVLTKYLKTLLADDKFADKLDANKGILAFKNGIVDLETRQFRAGIQSDDYITQTIPYDYNPADQDKKEFIKRALLKILNNNQEHLDYFLSIIGYSFIGAPNLEKSIYFCVDKTNKASGDNGKTFFFDILTTLLPNYVYKSKGSFLEQGNTKIHKQLAMMKGKRLVWLDEFGKNKSNSELMKEIGDGLNTENEVMFGTSETINIMFKLFTLTNNLPVIDPKDTAVYNRYKQISYGSHFDRTGSRTEEDPDNLLFIADTTLGDKIKEQYYNEVFEIIIEYANKYYSCRLPAIPSQFVKDTKETQQSNDEFGQWFADHCELDPNGRIALDLIIESSGTTKKLAKEGMSRFGFKYEKDLCKLGRDNNGKFYKGGYCGVTFKEKEEEEEEE